MESKEGCGTIFAVLGGFCLIVLIIYGIAAFNASTWEPWVRNQHRKAIVQSNGFIETQQEKIRDALQQFDNLDRDISYYSGTPGNEDLVDGMKRSQVDHVQDMCDASDDIPDDEIPNKDRVIPLMLKVGCWSPQDQETQ